MLSAEQVLEYLERHPDFLMRHPGLLTMLTPPARPLGDTVVDFQQFQVKSLQENTRALQAEHEGLVEFCRHQHSVQAVVHDAVLQLVQARNLNQLLEAITVDLLALFDVDVVRLGLESSVANQYENDFYAEHNYSGIVFLEEGVVNAALPPPHRAALVADIRAEVPAGVADAFEQIFTDCTGLVQSCALLKLELAEAQREAMLALGVRHSGRFQAGEDIELLSFLAQIAAHQLDRYLADLSV